MSTLLLRASPRELVAVFVPLTASSARQTVANRHRRDFSADFSKRIAEDLTSLLGSTETTSDVEGAVGRRTDDQRQFLVRSKSAGRPMTREDR